MTCEECRLAAMASVDGERSQASPAAIEAHLTACEECREQIEQLRELNRIWQGQGRANYQVDVWPKIESRMGRSKGVWLPVLGVLLVVFKLATLVPDRHFSLWLQVMPILMAIAAFAALRQNPFEIHTEIVFQETE